MKNKTFKVFLLENDEKSFYPIPIETLDKIVPMIKRDCSEFLRNSDRDNMLYRGVEKRIDYFVQDVRLDRQPLDINYDVHLKLNSFFKNEFGFRYRSGSAFATTSTSQARQYGRIFWFFPVDGYKLLTSKKVKDLYLALEKPPITDSRKTLMFKEKYSRNILGDEKYNEYKELCSYGSRSWDEGRLLDELNWSIFQELGYEEITDVKKIPTGFEVMVKTERFYCISKELKGVLPFNGTTIDDDDVMNMLYD